LIRLNPHLGQNHGPARFVVQGMGTYRAYLLDTAGKIRWAEWIEAESVEAAEAQARTLCVGGTPVIELWSGSRKIAQLPCEIVEQPKPRR
jgi:hypothetical protein